MSQHAYLMVFVVLASATPAWAQSEAAIRGQVVAAADGSVVAAATVTLQSASTEHRWQTGSDTTGRFAFHLVAPGPYVLSAETEGFARSERRVSIEPRELMVITLPLVLRPVEATVEVTGNAAIVSSIHSPSSTVLTSARVDSLPASQRHNLPDAIVFSAPGMIRGHDDFVHIRGHEVALNPIINGVSFWENPHSLMSAGLSPMVIETANVMTGGFPAEYGNRFGGVLDVVTKSGLRMQNDGSLSATGGDAGRRSLAGEFGGHGGRFGYYVFGSLFQSDRFLSPPDRKAIHDRGRGGRLFFQADANLREAGSVRMVLMADGANFQIPNHPRDLELRPRARARQRTRQESAIASWTRAGSEVSIAGSFYQRWSGSRLSPAGDPLAATAQLDREMLTLGGKLDVTRFIARHAVKAGVDIVRLRPDEVLSYDYAGYRDLTHALGWPHIHVVGGPIDFAGRDSGGQVSAYIQDGVEIAARVSANVGVRVDRYDLAVSATHASPRFNLAWDIGGDALVHASYNHFFVPPPVEGVLSSNAGLTARIREVGVPLRAIEPTIEDQIEFGVSKPVGPVRLAATGYHRVSDNPVHTTVWPDSRIYSYASFDRARAYGLEMKAELPGLTRYGMTGYLNYAVGRVNFYNPVTGGFVAEAGHIGDTSRFPAPMDQTHTMTGGATYRHANGIWAGTVMEYGSGTPMGHGRAAHDHEAGEVDHEHALSAGRALRVPRHFTANFSVGADLLRFSSRRGRLLLQVDVENVTNRVYLIAQDGEFSPAQYSPPRLVAATVRLRF